MSKYGKTELRLLLPRDLVTSIRAEAKLKKVDPATLIEQIIDEHERLKPTVMHHDDLLLYMRNEIDDIKRSLIEISKFIASVSVPSPDQLFEVYKS